MPPTLRPLLRGLPSYKPGRRPAPGQDLARLASNETPLGPLPSVIEAVSRALAEGNRYPDPAVTELTAALAAKHGLPEARVAVGCGSVSLIQQLVQIAADPGEEVMYAWRSFEAYPGFVKVAGARPVEVPLDGYEHDLERMAGAVTDATRLVILCSPNNPTGPALREADVRRFLESIRPDILVVVDEAYAEFVDDPAAVDGRRLLPDHPNLAVLRTFSKAYGLAGLRVGFCLAGSDDTAAALRQVQVPFSVSLPAQAAALASLQIEDELLARVATIRAEREPLRTALRDLGYDVPPAQGNFVWLPVGPDTLRVADVFDQAGVLVRPFDGDGIRITVTTADDRERVVAAAKQALG
ncbi:MAG: histidinol-phosphate aminotransferase [Actinomycetota bacterium]|jgi:histidinol-phosphate aminotransferase|nr:histidinol-phosphate aminotransferase [Actinomycetota bacterium]